MSSYASIDREARMRVLLWAWLSLVILVLSGIAPAWHLAGEYSGNAVVLRPWMLVYNSIILALHATALAFILYGGTGSIPRAGNTILFWSRKVALITLGFAFLSAVTMLAAPVATGSGPFPPDGSHVRLYTILVHLPSLLRGLGWACLVVAMLQSGWSERSKVLPLLVLLFVLADLAVVAWHWIDTDIAVVAVFHPYITEPLYLAPWVCGSVLFLFLVRSELITRLKNPVTATLTGMPGATQNAVERFKAKEQLENNGQE